MDFKSSDIRLRDGYKGMETKERSNKRRGLGAKYFGLIWAIIIVTILLATDVPLLDRLLAILIVIPIFLSPEKAPIEELPSIQSFSQMIFWGFKRAFRGIWWDVLFFLALFSLIYALGYKGSLTLRPSLAFVSSYYWFKFFYRLHRVRKGV